MLTPMQKRAVDMATGGHPLDMTRNLMIAKGTGWDADALRIILDKRAAWLDYLSETQRRWQRNARSFRKSNHHDSLVTRERYVRCVSEDRQVPAAYHMARADWLAIPNRTHPR